MRFLFGAALLLLGGCGQSYCESYAHDLEDCEGDYEATDDDIEACEAMMEPCSSADEGKLKDYNRCLQDEGAGFCPEDFEETTTPTGTGDLPAWMDAMVACQPELDGLSSECLSAMGLGTETQAYF